MAFPAGRTPQCGFAHGLPESPGKSTGQAAKSTGKVEATLSGFMGGSGTLYLPGVSWGFSMSCLLHASDPQGLANGIARLRPPCLWQGLTLDARHDQHCSVAPVAGQSAVCRAKGSSPRNRVFTVTAVFLYILMPSHLESFHHSTKADLVRDQGASARSGMPISKVGESLPHVLAASVVRPTPPRNKL